MARTDRSLAKGVFRPFLKPLLSRIGSLAERTETLESTMDTVQARLVEMAHAQQQASARQTPLLDAAQLLDVLQRRVSDLEAQVHDARRMLEDLLEAVSKQNAVAREARRQSLQVEGDLSEAMTRIEKRLDMGVVAGQRPES